MHRHREATQRDAHDRAIRKTYAEPFGSTGKQLPEAGRLLDDRNTSVRARLAR